MTEHKNTVFLTSEDNPPWIELHRAKMQIIGGIWHQPDNDIWIAVELLDRILSRAVEAGEFEFPERGAMIRKSDLPGPESPVEGDLCWDQDRAVGMEWCEGVWKDLTPQQWMERHGGR